MHAPCWAWREKEACGQHFYGVGGESLWATATKNTVGLRYPIYAKLWARQTDFWLGPAHVAVRFTRTKK